MLPVQITDKGKTIYIPASIVEAQAVPPINTSDRFIQHPIYVVDDAYRQSNSSPNKEKRLDVIREHVLRWLYAGSRGVRLLKRIVFAYVLSAVICMVLFPIVFTLLIMAFLLTSFLFNMFGLV